MNICATCRWWGYGRTKELESKAFWQLARPCGAITHDQDHTGSDPGGYLPRGVKAQVLDGSGYFAALRTAADFGCVLHKPLREVGPDVG